MRYPRPKYVLPISCRTNAPTPSPNPHSPTHNARRHAYKSPESAGGDSRQSHSSNNLSARLVVRLVAGAECQASGDTENARFCG